MKFRTVCLVLSLFPMAGFASVFAIKTDGALVTELHNTAPTLSECNQLSGKAMLALLFDDQKKIKLGSGCWVHNPSARGEEISLLIKNDKTQEITRKRLPDSFFDVLLSPVVMEDSDSLIATYTKVPQFEGAGKIVVLLSAKQGSQCEGGNKAATVLMQPIKGRQSVNSNGCWEIRGTLLHYESKETSNNGRPVVFDIPVNDFTKTKYFKSW